MQHNGIQHNGIAVPSGQPAGHLDKRALTESVAYALWEERKRRELPDDPEADWYHAEELITELWHFRPPDQDSFVED